MRIVIALLLGPLALAGCDRQEAVPPQANATGNAASAPSPDEVQATPGDSAPTPAYLIDRSHKGEALPKIVFADVAGKDASLTGFAGKPLLVNLWATWCGPCVAEMPQLDAVAGAHAKSGLQLLAISQDSGGADKVVPFFTRNGYKHLKLYLDPETQLMSHYGAAVLPTSILYGRGGKEIARVTGPLDWESKEAAALIAEAVAG